MVWKFQGYSGDFLRSRGLLVGFLSRDRVRGIGRRIFTGPRWGLARKALSVVPWNRIFTFPPAVIVELTNHCNLDCTMCLRALSSGESFGFMSRETFRRVLDEVRTQPGVRLGLCSNRGESMLHPDYLNFVAAAKASVNGVLYTMTNATKMDATVSSALVDLGVDEIEISVDGATKETFEKIRVGANYEQVVGNIRQLVAIRDMAGRHKPRIMVRMVVMDETEQEIAAFKDQWQRWLGPNDCISLQSYMSPQTSSPGLELRRHWDESGRQAPPCKDLWRCLMVRWDGALHFCDTMHDASLGIGANIASRSIRDVWVGKELQRIRKLHLRGKRQTVPSCMECHCSYSFLGNEKDGVVPLDRERPRGGSSERGSDEPLRELEASNAP